MRISPLKNNNIQSFRRIIKIYSEDIKGDTIENIPHRTRKELLNAINKGDTSLYNSKEISKIADFLYKISKDNSEINKLYILKYEGNDYLISGKDAYTYSGMTYCDKYDIANNYIKARLDAKENTTTNYGEIKMRFSHIEDSLLKLKDINYFGYKISYNYLSDGSIYYTEADAKNHLNASDNIKRVPHLVTEECSIHI